MRGSVPNFFTHRDRRLRGLALLRGSFYAICVLDTIANVGIAGYIFPGNEVWWSAGLAGVAVGSVWTTQSRGFSLGGKKISVGHAHEDLLARDQFGGYTHTPDRNVSETAIDYQLGHESLVVGDGRLWILWVFYVGITASMLEGPATAKF
jgi:hypothetical protein